MKDYNNKQYLKFLIILIIDYKNFNEKEEKDKIVESSNKLLKNNLIVAYHILIMLYHEIRVIKQKITIIIMLKLNQKVIHNHRKMY